MKPLSVVSKMNSIEEEFAWMLEQRKRTGEIVDYAFEAMTFRLADRTTYTPDFVIVHLDHFELIDVKARGVAETVRSKTTGKVRKQQWTSKRDDAAVKMKVAADRFWWMQWAYYYHEADGRWTKEEVN